MLENFGVFRREEQMTRQVEIIAEVRERQAGWPAPIPFPAVSVEHQAALSHRLAVAVGVSPNTILRIWREGRLKPHRSETFKYSSDPELVA